MATRPATDLPPIAVTPHMTIPALTPHLNAALVAVQQSLPTVRKGNVANIPGKNGGTGYSYRYADLGDVTDAVLPLLNANGIAWVCEPRLTESGYEVVGTLLHESGEERHGALPLWGRQAQDLGSSLTYARRYLLGCMTGVVTEEDDDGARSTQRPSRAVPYSGPSTRDLLNRVDAIAADLGQTYENITAKWRRDHGNLSLDDLDAVEPERVQTLVTALENYLGAEKAKQQAQQPAPAEQTADPAAPDDPWAKPAAAGD